MRSVICSALGNSEFCQDSDMRVSLLAVTSKERKAQMSGYWVSYWQLRKRQANRALSRFKQNN